MPGEPHQQRHCRSGRGRHHRRRWLPAEHGHGRVHVVPVAVGTGGVLQGNAEHFKEGHFVHPSALFAPDIAELTSWTARYAAPDEADDDTAREVDELDGDQTEGSAHDHPVDDGHTVEETEAWRVAAE